MTNNRRSPLLWIGGKYYSAAKIVAAFPPPDQYRVFVDLFGGAGHVTLKKPPYKHLEIYNDSNVDLVNFWLQARDNTEALLERCASLPYSRVLYYDYHRSLWSGEQFSPVERAARWFYVVRSSYLGKDHHVASGWSAGNKSDGSGGDAQSYRSALDCFVFLRERMRFVLIDCRDFGAVLQQYDRPNTLLYADPPYIGAEMHYRERFRWEDHVRLAELANAAQAKMAISYALHPQLDIWYPASRWRRLTWEAPRPSRRSRSQRTGAAEVLLLNYSPEGVSAENLALWQPEQSKIA